MRVVLVGLGAVGSRSARQLLSSRQVDELVVLARHPDVVAQRASALGDPGLARVEQLSSGNFARAADGAGAVLLACGGPSLGWAEAAIARGTPVVSCSDDPVEVRALLELGPAALAQGVPLVVGAAMAPGLSCLLAWWACAQMDEMDEVHVATFGTGGPCCARRHHAAMREPLDEWREGKWARKMAGSGRELVWFPDQAGADCYRANRPDGLMLTLAFPSLRAATARAAASRRDRLTSWLPMLRRPHPEGTVGGVRVEARGRRAGQAESVIVGANGRPAVLAGTVAAAAAMWAASGRLHPGAGGLASLVAEPGHLLAELRERGTKLMAFQGASITPAW